MKSERAAIHEAKNLEKVGIIQTFTDRRFRSSTVFCIVSAVFNQLTGISAVNIYSSTIVAQSGFSVNLGVMLISTANVLGAFFASFESKFFPVKKYS
jgi:hypothetical protein